MLLTYANWQGYSFAPPPPVSTARGIPVVEVNQRGGNVTSPATTTTRVPNVAKFTTAHFRGSRLEIDLRFRELVDGDEEIPVDFATWPIWVTFKTDPNLADNASDDPVDGSPRVIQKTLNVLGGPGGITILDADDCLVRVLVEASDTEGVKKETTFEGDVKTRIPTTEATVCARGKNITEVAVTEDE